MIKNKVLTKQEKLNIENNVAALDERVIPGYAMLFSEALQNPTNGIACLVFEREYIGIKFVPFCGASSFPDEIEYIEKTIEKYKNNLDDVIFTWVSAYIGNRFLQRMHALKRPEAEYYLQVLEKYMN